MKIRALAGVLAIASMLIVARASHAADEATLFRLFLKDGGTLVAYGEIARVGDRVIFSMPTAPTGTKSPPPLHLTNLPADRIDWARTDRYALSARSGRYIETQAENDYTELSNQVAQTLNDVGLTNDTARRLALVEGARRMLVAWPPEHYNYREPDIRQMVSMLDAAIADLRTRGSAGAGSSAFAFNLVALATPAPDIEPIMPAPTLKESIEQVLLAARLSDSSADRVQLYRSALDELHRLRAVDPSVPTEYVTTTAAGITTAITTEVRTDRAYQFLTQRLLRLADLRAHEGDVRALERLVTRVHTNDRILGYARPDVVASLLAAIDEKLDAARRLQLARDRYALREPVLVEYRLAIAEPLQQFAALASALEDIKSLSGTPPGTLDFIERTLGRLSKSAGEIRPPDELVEAHALFVSALNLALNAATIRREATLASSITRAWDASSAAAGSLMLGSKARTDIQKLLRRPQLQ
jgi:hypothetical protein